MGGDGAAALVEVVGRLELAPVAGEIEQALWARDRLDAKISAALGGFGAQDEWGADGSLSLAAWLAAHGRRGRREAHREATVAVRLAQLPLTAAAWADGTLSSGQVAAIVAQVAAPRAGLFAQHEPALVPALAELSVGATAGAMRAWRLRAEALGPGPEPGEQPSQLYLSETLDGRREVAGHLGAEDAAVLEAAIAAAQGDLPADCDGPVPSTAQRRAEALVDVCRWFLAHGQKAPGGARHRPQLSVVVSLADLARGGPGHLGGGAVVPGATVSRLACDAVLHRLVSAGRSTILDYGSSVRTVSPALWAALVVRDGHCRHPGCDRPPSWCEAHHVRHFSRGGPTCLSNLVLACWRHHHLWHGQAWQLELGADATLALRSPLGKLITSRPPPVALMV